MAAKVYVGNLSWNTNDDSLAQAFSAYGQLTDYVSKEDALQSRLDVWSLTLVFLFLTNRSS
jgi:RNA recognition motif-containing protein